MSPTFLTQRLYDNFTQSLTLKRVLLKESQVQPLLLVFEDLHWIDNETQALLDNLVESLPTARLLMLVNYRPEYQHSWGSKTYYTQLRLDPLQAESAEGFLAALLGDDPGLAPLKQLLIARTEGNPFFLEESVRTLVESGLLSGEPGSYRVVQELPAMAVPPTVQAILAARIDRLPLEEKQLLQTAAVIGMEVPFSLLQVIADLPEETLHRSLSHLQVAEFLYETNLYPEREYTFKHALTHEVAYGSLLQERRRVLHAQIVQVLESLASDGQPDQVERLAHHAVRGELWDKALVYLRQAGARAIARSAHHEAVTYFEQALAALQHLPAQRDTHEQAIDIRLDLRSARIALGELARILLDLQEAEVLAEALGDQARLGRVSVCMTAHLYIIGEYDRGMVSGQRTLALATACGDIGSQVVAHIFLNRICHAQGHYHQAVAHARRAVACLEGDQLHEHFAQAILPASFSRICLSHSLAEMGAFVESMASGDAALHIAEAVNHPLSLMLALWASSTPYLHQGDLRTACPILERAMAMCRDLDLPLYFGPIATALGEAYTLCGRANDAVLLLQEAVQRADAIGMAVYQAQTLILLSKALLLTNQLQKAIPFAERALEHARTHKERGIEACALRLLGDIVMHHDPPDIAQAKIHYQQALALATELGMRPLQAHCHRRLGTLYHQTGQYEQARAELFVAIEMYRDMEMTFWLPETEAALADVEGEA